MPTDAYIKFGDDDSDPNDYPLIEGDSTDDQHYWWCELRDFSADLKAADRKKDDEHDSHGEEARPTFEPVTIKKRVDWASTQLFTKVCEAAKATTMKSDDDEGIGRINVVTIHICRQAGDKFPFLTVKYFGVTLTDYGIDLSGPEPSESVTMKYEKFKFCYQPTSPETGVKKGGEQCTGQLQNLQPVPATPGPTGATTTAAWRRAVPHPLRAPPVPPRPLPPQCQWFADDRFSRRNRRRRNYPGLVGATGIGILPD
jgi:type VI protein secretion system component Hcp